MDETACLWNYQESVDELNQRLLSTFLELEQVKIESAEESRRTNEYVNQLLQLIELACKERDEARYQLQNLLLNNYHSYSSSSNDSIFEPVLSPDFSNSSNIDLLNHHHHPLILGCDNNNNNNVNNTIPRTDQESLLIDNIVKGKPLPQKGMFLKAVLEAGPLLQNLLVAGPLPRWRNPPQHESTFKVPPVSMKGCDSKFNPNSIHRIDSRSMSLGPFSERSCFSRSLSGYVEKLGNGGYGTCLGSDNTHFQLGKRQRLY